MRGNLVSAAFVALVATALPASTQRVSYDDDKAFDFAGAKTFRWEAGSHASFDEDLRVTGPFENFPPPAKK